jgi:hypothetical protein
MSLTSYRAAPPRAKDKAALASRAARKANILKRSSSAFGRPGNDLLSQVLRHSTIGAEAFDGRVRDGIGSYRLAEGHQAGEEQITEDGIRRTEDDEFASSVLCFPYSVFR